MYIDGHNCWGAKCKTVCQDCLIGDYELGWRNWHEISSWFGYEYDLTSEDTEIEIKSGQKFIVTDDQLICYKKITIEGILLIDPTKGDKNKIKFCAQII